MRGLQTSQWGLGSPLLDCLACAEGLGCPQQSLTSPIALGAHGLELCCNPPYPLKEFHTRLLIRK